MMYQSLLISLTSDSNVNFWKTFTPDEYTNNVKEDKVDKGFMGSRSRKSDLSSDLKPNPTTCTFLNSDNSNLAVGFNDCYISLYNLNKVK